MSDTTPATLSPEELEAVIAAAADALYKRGWPWYFPTTDSESFSECQRKHTIEDFSKIMRAHFAAHAAPTTPPGTESPRPAESTATRGALEDAADIIYRLARAIDSQRRCMGMEDAREIAAVVSAALAAPTPAAATPAPAGEAKEVVCGEWLGVRHSELLIRLADERDAEARRSHGVVSTLCAQDATHLRKIAALLTQKESNQ